MMSEAVIENFGKPDVIVGVATGAIAIGVLVAQELGLPFIYVRSSAKGHGRQNLIEGAFEAGSTRTPFSRGTGHHPRGGLQGTPIVDVRDPRGL